MWFSLKGENQQRIIIISFGGRHLFGKKKRLYKKWTWIWLSLSEFPSHSFFFFQTLIWINIAYNSIKSFQVKVFLLLYVIIEWPRQLDNRPIMDPFYTYSWSAWAVSQALHANKLYIELIELYQKCVLPKITSKICDYVRFTLRLFKTTKFCNFNGFFFDWLYEKLPEKDATIKMQKNLPARFWNISGTRQCIRPRIRQ